MKEKKNNLFTVVASSYNDGFGLRPRRWERVRVGTLEQCKAWLPMSMREGALDEERSDSDWRRAPIAGSCASQLANPRFKRTLRKWSEGQNHGPRWMQNSTLVITEAIIQKL